MLRIEKEKGRYAGLVEAPFKCERQLEDYIASDPAAIGLDRIVARQLSTGVGVVDLLGVGGGRLAVIEVKAGAARRSAVAQAACYASWFDSAAEDEIRDILPGGRPQFPPHIWLVVVATDIAADAVHVAKVLKYPVSFFTIRRWRRQNPKKKGGGRYIVQTAPYSTGDRKPRILEEKGENGAGESIAEWTPARYETTYRSETVREFFARTEEIREFAAAQGWRLLSAYRGRYSAFKRKRPRGVRVRVFGVRLISRLTPVLYFVLPKDTAGKLAPAPMRHYYKYRREAWFDITEETEVGDFAALFDAAYAAAGA